MHEGLDADGRRGGPGRSVGVSGLGRPAGAAVAAAVSAHPAAAGDWVLGVDSGGSGVRVALARADGSAVSAPACSTRPAVTGERGIDAGSLLGVVLPLARELMDAAGAGRIGAACVGAAGMATLGADLRARLPQALDEALGVRALALAGDVVTAYAGALGLRPGVVVAAGTGMIALGTSGAGDGWRRADGWGHLLGDAGGGAWIGREGLAAAMRAHDGRTGGSPALLARLRERFGAPESLPGQLYPRADRPAVLASFAPDVAACAAGDPVAADILRRAAAHILEAAAAVLPALAPVSGQESAHACGHDGGRAPDAGARACAGPAGTGPLTPSQAGGQPPVAAPGAAAPVGVPQAGAASYSVQPAGASPGALEPVDVALAGGLFRMGEPLLAPLREQAEALLPGARLRPAAGDPLDGAVLIASALRHGTLTLPADPALLTLVHRSEGPDDHE